MKPSKTFLNTVSVNIIRPRMYVRLSIMYEKAAFCSPEENSSVAR